MHFTVDKELCIGCGACMGLCSEVFEVLDGKSEVIADPVPDEYQECALSAEDSCPAGAISHG
ncbi:MAG: ferredoxin [Candidatus Fermentibacteria bacterium]